MGGEDRLRNRLHYRTPRGRVLFHYSSQQFDTGSPKAMVAIMRMLEGTEYTPVYLSLGPGPLVDELYRLGIEVVFGDVEELSIRKPFQVVSRVLRQRRVLQELNVDLVHMNQFGWNQDLALAAWLKKVPVVLHCHNATRIDPKNLNRFAAKKVLVVSERHKTTIENFNLVSDRCEVLYNAVDMKPFKEACPIRSSLRLSENSVVVGTVAQICHRKGIDIILQTAKALLPKYKELVFLIIGPAAKNEASYADEMMSISREQVFDGRVRFLGSRDDVPELLKSMDIFFLPTRAEPFGIVFVEALAAGIPVVASRVGGVPEIVISNDIGLLVDPDDVNTCVAAIATLLERSDKGKELGLKGQQSIHARFDAGVIRSRIAQIYADALGD